MIINNNREPRPGDGEPTEETSLLAGQEAVDPLPNKPFRFIQFQKTHLALPVVFFGLLSATIATTAYLQILNYISCQLWWGGHDPSRIPPDGNIPDELCHDPGVQKLFSQIFMFTYLLDLCGGLFTSSPIGTLSAKFGRKPILIAVTSLTTISPLLFILGLKSVSLSFILLSVALSAVGGPRQILLLCTMFVVDTSPDPAPVLSSLEGSIYLGSTISYALGGLITSRTGSLTNVFWTQEAISIVLFFYVLFAIPETFGREKRAARAAEVAAERERGRGRTSSRSSRSRSVSLERVRDTAGTFARPFALLWPRRDPVTGKRNKRLLVLAIGITVAIIGATYVGPAFLVFSTNRFNASPEQTGYTLSMLAALKTVYLFFILPPLLRWGRPVYNRRWRSGAVGTDVDSSNSHLDVIALAIAWTVDAVAVVGIGLSKTLGAATICVMFVSIGSGASPCISSIVSASVEPLARGEALAAMALIRSTAEFLSPLIILLFIGAGIVILIRDEDRYIPPEEAAPNVGLERDCPPEESEVGTN
ncbi:MFS general substrate transporter [Ceratobasidium sp. AG-I]|nr:MFS general substrate transporter [Ceratobasidium sp. AG-I]